MRNLYQVKDCVYQMMENVQEIYRGKSGQISESRRLEADHLFATGKADKALLMYTHSIIRAPNAGISVLLKEAPAPQE